MSNSPRGLNRTELSMQENLSLVEEQKISDKIKATKKYGTKIDSKSRTLYNSNGKPVYKVEVYESQRPKKIQNGKDILGNDITESLIEKTEAIIITPATSLYDPETISVEAYITAQFAQGTTSEGNVGYRLISANGGWVNHDNQIISINHSATICNTDKNGGGEWNAPVSNATWSMTNPSSHIVSMIPADWGLCGAKVKCTIYEAMYPQDRWDFHFKVMKIDSKPY